MQAGSYEYPITILQHQEVVSEYGDQGDRYVNVGTTHAYIQPTGGGRTDAIHEAEYIYRKTFVIRSYINVTEFDRIQFDGKMWRIMSIERDRIKNQKTLQCEIVNDVDIYEPTPQPTPGDNNTTNPIEQPIDQPWGS